MRARQAAQWALVVVTIFCAVSAVGGGIGVVATDGLGMPRSMLQGGPFPDFVLPGVILTVVVGGTQSLAAALLLARRGSALVGSAVAGFGLVIWIFVETGIIAGTSWLQVLYFAAGSAELALVLVLLGVIRRPGAHDGSARPTARA